MKTIKEGEERKREILLVARELFVTKGYDHTSIKDILEVVDIAKGTFYYYFSSKEEVLETIILDIVEEGAKKAERILQDKSVPLPERIMMAIKGQSPDFEGSEEIKTELHKVENAKLQQLYLRAMLARMTGVLEKSMAEGVEEGTIHTDYPRECVEAILLLGHMMFDCDTFDWKMEEYPKKIMAFLTAIERMLGMQAGQLQGFMQMFVS